MMMWMTVTLVVLVLSAVAAVAAGRSGTWEGTDGDRVASVLPEGRLTAADVRRVRFPLVVRGSRMTAVDALLARLADQLEEPRRSAGVDEPQEPAPVPAAQQG